MYDHDLTNTHTHDDAHDMHFWAWHTCCACDVDVCEHAHVHYKSFCAIAQNVDTRDRMIDALNDDEFDDDQTSICVACARDMLNDFERIDERNDVDARAMRSLRDALNAYDRDIAQYVRTFARRVHNANWDIRVCIFHDATQYKTHASNDMYTRTRIKCDDRALIDQIERMLIEASFDMTRVRRYIAHGIVFARYHTITIDHVVATSTIKRRATIDAYNASQRERIEIERATYYANRAQTTHERLHMFD